MSRPLRGKSGAAALRQYIGCRVHFRGEDIHGTIIDVTLHRGTWPRWVIRWDEGAPEWWGMELNPGAGGLEVET